VPLIRCDHDRADNPQHRSSPIGFSEIEKPPGLTSQAMFDSNKL
jgi:hypothetical protein